MKANQTHRASEIDHYRVMGEKDAAAFLGYSVRALQNRRTAAAGRSTSSGLLPVPWTAN